MYSTLQTLIVGCTTDMYQINSASFVTSTTIYVGGTTTNVYRFYPPTPYKAWCPLSLYEIVSLADSGWDTTSVSSSRTSLTFADTGTTSCDPTVYSCIYLNIGSTSFEQTLTWKVRTSHQYLASSTRTHDSPSTTLNVDCKAASTTITPAIANDTVHYEQYNTTNNLYWFPAFTCLYPDCCRTMSYRVVSQTSSPLSNIYTPQFTTPANDSSTTSVEYVNFAGVDLTGDYYTEVYTGEITVYSIYIHVTNEWGDTAISTVVTVTINYNCLFDAIQLNPAFPVAPEEVRAAEYVTTSGVPVFVFDKYIGDSVLISSPVSSRYKVNLTNRFIHNVTVNCSLESYRINTTKLLTTRTEVASALWTGDGSLFSVGYSTGIFTFDNFGYAYTNYIVYIEACNSKIWGGADVSYLVDATLRANTALPNMPPFFAETPQNYTIAIDVLKYPNGTMVANDNRTLTFAMPALFDATNDVVTPSIANAADLPFATYVDGSLVVDTSKITLSQVGRH